MAGQLEELEWEGKEGGGSREGGWWFQRSEGDRREEVEGAMEDVEEVGGGSRGPGQDSNHSQPERELGLFRIGLLVGWVGNGEQDVNLR